MKLNEQILLLKISNNIIAEEQEEVDITDELGDKGSPSQRKENKKLK